MEEKEIKPIGLHKSSAEILSELFNTLHAEAPLLDKKLKKHKKSKKKHKHKDKKKHKKKSKHKYNSDTSDDESSEKRKKKLKTEYNSDSSTSNSDSFDLSRIKKEPLVDIKDLFASSLKSETNDSKGDLNLAIPEVKDGKNEGGQEEKVEETVEKRKVDKIVINNLKDSLVFAERPNEDSPNLKVEDGEVLESSTDDEYLAESTKITLTKFKEKRSSSRHDRKRKHSQPVDKDTKYDEKTRDHHHHHRSRSHDRDKTRDYYPTHRDSKYNHRSHSYYRDSYKPREDNRYRPYDHRSTTTKNWRKSPSRSIDKKKLLEIARKNAIGMLKSGTLPEALTLGPQAQEKVIAAIKAGGKTINELTDFCKNLSKKEEMGELSSVSSHDEDEEEENNSASEKIFHHPFQIKDRPSSIVMNIKNSTPLPIKTSKEKSSELRMQFPVSSGTLHRNTENEWVPVTPKAIEPAPVPVPVPAPVPAPTQMLALPTPPTPKLLPAPKFQPASSTSASVFSMKTDAEVDISTVIAQRLSAMRKLQENPNDGEALNKLYKVQVEMESWAQSKQQPGQFTGSTGANILSAAQLNSGYQTWARKDQLQTAAPIAGGMGMHLLQKMGWKPGEGLGKEKTGSLEPLLLEVKLDKRGLVANDEVKSKKQPKVPKPTTTCKTLAGKHPVSLLGEFATKRKLGIPQYECCFECGPDHKKNFLFKVILNGVEYKPNVASSTKKQAKADAANICLQALGLFVT